MNGEPIPDDAMPYRREEVIALMNYVVETGLDPKAKIVEPLNKALITGQNQDEILKLYTSLCKITYGKYRVNGRTLIDTDTHFLRQSKGIMRWTVFILFLALVSEALNLWFQDMPMPEEGWYYWLFVLHHYLLDNISPFLWGATGACVFLLKQLSDRAADRCFDKKRWKGWGTRILLGALLGAIVVVIYDRAAFTGSGLNLTANALAFLAGLGVKVIYGAIEKLIETIATKFNLGDQGRMVKPPSEIISEFLANRLGKAIESGDKEKQKLLKELINDLSSETIATA